MPTTLKPQPPMSPPAEEYTTTVLKLSQEVQMHARVELDVAYGPDEEQQLDLYLPDNPKSESVEVLMFMHGGAWTHGYKDWMGFMAPAITRLPAIFVSVGYRLAPDAKFPTPVEDCQNALRWICDNIGGYGGDPGSIFVGGHLAALMTLQPDALRELGLPKTSSSLASP